MIGTSFKAISEEDMRQHLAAVAQCMAGALESTTLGFLAKESKGLLGSGKMLRSRLAFRVGVANGIDLKTLTHAAAATELIHSASLLHDDVIDGGQLRRGAPAFWVEKGVAGAILLGDLLLFKGIDLICQVEDGRLTHELVKLTGEVCEAESEQELILQGEASKLETCMSISRRKTGALFAFTALAAAGEHSPAFEVTKEAGYKLGTAYQLADDLLDASGTVDISGKTLGTDQRRDIISAASLSRETGEDPVAAIEELTRAAIESAAEWPAIAFGMQEFVQQDLQPSLDKLLASYAE